ncbi:hypothetical protein EVAR_37731_1 [Eumeta japonica]|uniref:Uncharacterized protein n=1 Tax=Eumeta variegata TaxID=151549 RepID=A0A4C1YQD3_EUMVA|nr:hypothetical protein EVAR_37731_1 [Eumeta japonica]
MTKWKVVQVYANRTAFSTPIFLRSYLASVDRGRSKVGSDPWKGETHLRDVSSLNFINSLRKTKGFRDPLPRKCMLVDKYPPVLSPCHRVNASAVS